MKLYLKIFVSFITINAILLAAVSVSFYRYQKLEIISSIRGKVAVTEQSIQSIADIQQQTLKETVMTVSEDWGLRSAIGRKEEQTVISVLNNHRIRVGAKDAAFLANDGRIVSSSQTIPPGFLDIKDKALSGGVLRPYRIVSLEEQYYQLVVFEVKAPQRIGWLLMCFSLGELQQAISDSSEKNDVTIAIVEADSKEVVLASRDISTTEVANVFSSIATEINARTAKFRFLNPAMIGKTSSASLDDGLSIVVFASTHEAINKFNAFWQQKILVAVIIFALVSVCVTYMTARSITRPLYMLLATSRRLRDGDFSTVIDVDRKDEIGDLAIAFKQMQQAIFEREQEVKKSISTLQHQANHDALTGLGNRRTLSETLITANESLAKRGENYSVFIMDLDGFKVVNDTSGHPAGDALLINIATLIKESVYTNDTVVRLGGDEFALVLHNCSESKALAIAEEIRQKIEELVFHWEGMAHRVSTSIGVISISEPGYEADEILKRADIACFSAKENGKNQVYLLSEDQATGDKSEQLQWVQRIHSAVDNDELILYVQPVVPLKETESVERLEVLVRLRNYQNNQLVSPVAFIPTAERHGLHTKIDHWVVTQLLKIAPVYRDIFDEERMFWVNLSGGSLCDERFIDFLESVIQQDFLPKGALNFEITETAVIKNIEQASSAILRIKKLGCQFALDDFGSGQASFNYLKALPVDYLKIEGTFIRNMVNSDVDRIFVKSMVDIAHAMGIKTVAELIEDQDILDVIKEIGVDYGQGYFLGKPSELLPRHIDQTETSGV